MKMQFLISTFGVLVFLQMICNTHSSCPVSKRRKKFYSIDSTSLGIRLLGNNFTSDSKAICASACQSKYPSTCQSFIYDPVTKECLPGGQLAASETKGRTGQLMYSNCDLSLGYSYSILIQFGYCFYTSLVPVVMTTAEVHCQSISGRLMSVKDLRAMQFLTNYSLQQSVTASWIGLDDRSVEGVCNWSDGTPANMAEIAKFFFPGEPNDSYNEDCFIFGRRSEGFGLIDVSCSSLYPFICEYVV